MLLNKPSFIVCLYWWSIKTMSKMHSLDIAWHLWTPTLKLYVFTNVEGLWCHSSCFLILSLLGKVVVTSIVVCLFSRPLGDFNSWIANGILFRDVCGLGEARLHHQVQWYTTRGIGIYSMHTNTCTCACTSMRTHRYAHVYTANDW